MRVELARFWREYHHRHADGFENSEFILILTLSLSLSSHSHFNVHG